MAQSKPWLDTSPISLAHKEMLLLQLHPDYGQIGSPGLVSAETEQENKRRALLRRPLELEIIERHGVVDEYLTQAYARKKPLQDKLVAVLEEIAELEALKKMKGTS